jgi:hypothetical protein
LKFSILKEKITPEFPLFEQGFSGQFIHEVEDIIIGRATAMAECK